MTRIRAFLALLAIVVVPACGGSDGGESNPAVWAPVDAAIQAALPQFPDGLAVEVLTPAGVVYSSSWNGFTPSTFTGVASASKWVSGVVLLRLVDQGILGLDTKTSALLVDRTGSPWTGNLGNATLRHLMSFTTGISGDQLNADLAPTLTEAVLRIYDGQAATASAPGSYFDYGGTHLRIAGRMAEVATGKTWAQIFRDQVGDPLGWDPSSGYGSGNNPGPAGTLSCTGLEYMEFVALQLRRGLHGTARLVPEALMDEQKKDQYGPSTVILGSPYVAAAGLNYHYGLCNWLETAGGGGPTPADPAIRYSSTGAFGWAPWITSDYVYGAVIMTHQPSGVGVLPSETLKAALDPLIRAALSTNPPVLRPVP